MCHVISSLFLFFFLVFTLFNLASSSTIVFFFVQIFIFSNHVFLNFSFDFLYIFINSTVSLFWTFHLLPPFQPFIFINFTVLLFWTFHLLPPLLFQLDFLINFFCFISTSLPYSFQVVHCKKVNTLSLSHSLSLSLSKFVSFDAFFYLFFQPLFSPLIVLFVIVDLIVTLHLFLFLVKLYRPLCIFRYFGIPILDQFFFSFFIVLVIHLDVKLWDFNKVFFFFKSFWVNKIVVFVEKILLIIVLEILYI